MAELQQSNTQAPAGAPKASRREWFGLGVIALPCLLYSMDLTVLNLAVPQISAELKPTASQLLWIVDIYGFLVAGALITMGTLGDRIGRRKLLMIGAVAFGLASVLAAFSASAEMLIVCCWLISDSSAISRGEIRPVRRSARAGAGCENVILGLPASAAASGLPAPFRPALGLLLGASR